MPARIKRLAASLAVVLVVTESCLGLADTEPPNLLVVSYYGTSHDYPVELFRFVGGPNREVDLTASRLHQDGGRYGSDSIPLPSRGDWPVVAMLVAPSGDTLALGSSILHLEPGRVVSVSILPLHNRYEIIPCPTLIAQAPISRMKVPADTMYVFTEALRPGENGPVC